MGEKPDDSKILIGFEKANDIELDKALDNPSLEIPHTGEFQNESKDDHMKVDVEDENDQVGSSEEKKEEKNEEDKVPDELHDGTEALISMGGYQQYP